LNFSQGRAYYQWPPAREARRPGSKKQKTIRLEETAGGIGHAVLPLPPRVAGFCPVQKEYPMNGRRVLRAFTLIELLLVLVILAVLASVAVPIYLRRAEGSRRSATIAEISNLKSALGTFEVDNARLPETSEGLAALIACPAGMDATWRGPYIDTVPLDKWGHAYVYTCPGVTDPASFDLLSWGDDGIPGTADDIDKYTTH
jgi:general secretion pathway protein G